jgi:hypothetical protein
VMTRCFPIWVLGWSIFPLRSRAEVVAILSQ